MAGCDDRLSLIGFPDGPHGMEPGPDWLHDTSAFVMAKEQLTEYFIGKRQAFSIPLDIQGTPFQRRVWGALQSIPFGTTRTYGDLAKEIGRPKAARAVGAANGANPLPIVVPCHRLVASDGDLIRYGGGLDRKRALLDLERGCDPKA